MPGENLDRCNLARLVIGDDMHDSHALGRSSQALAILQGMMLRLREHPLSGHQPLPVCLEGWRKKASTLAMA